MMVEHPFVGRAYEQRFYQDFLRGRDGSWFLVISGMGGIGKSASLERFKAQTPENVGIVFLDLSAEPALCTDPLHLLQALAERARPFCGPEQYRRFHQTLAEGSGYLSDVIQRSEQLSAGAHDDPSGRAQHTYALAVVQEMNHQVLSLATDVLCSTLGSLQRPKLVIMFDTCELLDEPESWETKHWLMDRFLPALHMRLPERCYVVMASRTALYSEIIDREEQRHIQLSFLDQPAVDQYLERVGVYDPEARRHLYRITHGHALSVRIIGDLWHQMNLPSLDDTESASLEETFDAHALTEFINERILERLKSPYRELTQYGVLLRTFTLPLLRAVFPELLHETEARAIFETLIHFPYVEPRDDHRYAFHELIREVLARKIHRDDPEAWQRYHKRALDYLASVPQGASYRSPEWHYHAIAYSEALAMEAWQQALQEARVNGSLRELGALLQVAHDHTLSLEPLSQARLAYEQGRFDDDMAQTRQALTNYERALALFQQIGHRPREEATVLLAMGDAQRSRTDLEAALRDYEQALSLFEQVQDRTGQALALHAIGDIQRLRKNWSAALESYTRALPLLRRSGDLQNEAAVYQAQGDIYRFLGQTHAAHESYQQALSLLRLSGVRFKESEARLLRAIGDVQLQERDMQAATESYQKALVFFRGNTLDEEIIQQTMRGIPTVDFSSDAETLRVVAEGERLTYGSQFSCTFATEISRIEPLPHQISAVYKHMLQKDPLRFLLADDAGAGKTIMAGLYIREMLTRRRISRVLIVPPAGLVGNWRHEMEYLFHLPFRIVGGAEARCGNPFCDRPESDLLIVSLDTLYRQPMFSHLQDPAVAPYDLVIFDEAHKLAAYPETNFRARQRKTRRYRLAEALAGAMGEQDRNGIWTLPWHCRSLLLLTATPHMGKLYPYYSLWRLLEPDALATPEAFERYPQQERQRHFICRTKEELVDFAGQRIYPQRNSDTLSYKLTPGEQQLYDETTNYISIYYNRAASLNRSAARLAMSVFQRRLASSTYALLCSLERRRQKLAALITALETRRLDSAALQQEQQQLDEALEDIFDTKTADEEEAEEGQQEENERVEAHALEAVVAQGDSLHDLRSELEQVERLLPLAHSVYDAADEAKFEELRGQLSRWLKEQEKLLIFTEYRDTLEFLTHRLESLGFAGQVVCIHGGMGYEEREEQIAFFRMPGSEGKAIMIATDAAGEGINLQFCHIMVNYDIPWNPARLEQRMGRIHRFGQRRNVMIINLVAGETREGKVIAALLKKLETIRRDLESDKVFDVIGRLFENTPLSHYMEQVLSGESSDTLATRIAEMVTPNRIHRLEEAQRRLYGDDTRVADEVPELKQILRLDGYRRFLPGYVRRFIEKAAPLIDLKIEYEGEGCFSLIPLKDRVADWWLPLPGVAPEEPSPVFAVDGRTHAAHFLHPGEAIFERLREHVCTSFALHAQKGATFIDHTATRPYLFHLARISLCRRPDEQLRVLSRGEVLATQLVGLRQEETGEIRLCAPDLLLSLYSVDYAHVSRTVHAWAEKAGGAVAQAEAFLREHVGEKMVADRRAWLYEQQPLRRALLERGLTFRAAELSRQRKELLKRIAEGKGHAQESLTRIRALQQELDAYAREVLEALTREPALVDLEQVEFLVHALVLPRDDALTARIEARAVQEAHRYEERQQATVYNVSTPEEARAQGLHDWPGFTLLSRRPLGEELAILVKGRGDRGDVELSENELAQACNLEKRYWLYVAFDCEKAHPRLYRVHDPFGRAFREDYSEKRRIIITEKRIYEFAEKE
jgi:SNF2 family DNA or RNA helicase